MFSFPTVLEVIIVDANFCQGKLIKSEYKIIVHQNLFIPHVSFKISAKINHLHAPDLIKKIIILLSSAQLGSFD